jgi:hypothetical protein
MMREQAVAVEFRETSGDQLELTLRFSKNRSRELKKERPDELTTAIKRAIKKAVSELGPRSGRIVAHVPRGLAAEFEELCSKAGTTVSRALLGRVSRYVGSDGELKKGAYRRTPQIPGGLRRGQKRIVQIVASTAQVEGFDEFCRNAGIKKGQFVMREMLLRIEQEKMEG